MEKIDQRIESALTAHRESAAVALRALEMLQQAEQSGFILPNSYDIPLMGRLGSIQPVPNNTKIAALI